MRFSSSATPHSGHSTLRVTPAKYVRDLGMYIDCDMSMKTQVTRTVSSCFAALRQIRRSVSQPVLLSLVISLVLSLLDYGISTLIGISRHLLYRLQSVLNAAARLWNAFPPDVISAPSLPVFKKLICSISHVTCPCSYKC